VEDKFVNESTTAVLWLWGEERGSHPIRRLEDTLDWVLRWVSTRGVRSEMINVA
jgi:hypothetical protein